MSSQDAPFTVISNCKELDGHYHDGLLKKCLSCAEVCGRHPPECSKHCQNIPSASPPPVITKKLLVVTSHVPNPRGPSVLLAPDDPTILLYSLLALCMVLLFSSLFLAFVVILRGPWAKTSKQTPKEADHKQESMIQPGQEVGQPGSQPGQRPQDFVTNSSCPTDREPSDDSSPTETCVCVHCFPDLKALGQGSDRPPTAPYSYYPQVVLHRAQTQNGGPLWTDENLYTSGPEVQEEANLHTGRLE
ncbi:tumor necrosis factor receptor superfamily member 13B [Dicentrarchus labrax]|uniref:tumor necrosis factor receptor superfamily member 13B n=1 Tax=Dicentrarchus labrax TaxID=13489 RepID=UPI0021F6323D|nr:tumor necrosis factor receptor superfamily member 13B [Dicentrarchus labrax]